jgi:hypothetical protein
MLLYITAEDVFGGETPERRRPRPRQTPSTLAALYDLGLRHHSRKAVLALPADGAFEPIPDWKLDRLAIRIALYARERLGLIPGSRLALFGRLGWLWPVVDFAALGFGAVSLGIEHDQPESAVASRLAEAAPRAVFATDPESAERLRRLVEAGRLPGLTVVAEGPGEAAGLVPLARLLDLGSTLDTPERAQAFRAVSRHVAPEAEALQHLGADGFRRLTHREAMERVEGVLRARPARAGNVAYIEGPRVSLRLRLAWAAFVGDGLTTTALGREGRAEEEVRQLRPHELLASAEWLERVLDRRGPRWPAGLDRPWARRRVLDVLGGNVRWVESERAPAAAAARALEAARVVAFVRDQQEVGAETARQVGSPLAVTAPETAGG